MAPSMSRLGVSSCSLIGVVEDRRFLMEFPRVSWSAIESHGSYLTTFVKGSSPRNGSKYVKTGGVLMPPNWGCGGQEVLDGVP